MDDEIFEVVIVDDDASVLAAFVRQVRLMSRTVKAFNDPTEALPHLVAGMGRCLVLDLSMPGLNGLELQQALSDRETPLAIVFLSGEGTVSATARAMKFGAIDFLEKPVEFEDLRNAIEEALESWAEKQSRAEIQGSAKLLMESLSPREQEVLELLATGASNKEMARQMDLSERTVKAHRASIRDKLGFTSVPELVSFWESLR